MRGRVVAGLYQWQWLALEKQVRVRNPRWLRRSAVFVLLLLVSVAVQADVLSRFQQLNRAGYLLTDDSGVRLAEAGSQQVFIPASTTKLVTALLALKHWGEDHRFSTGFTIDPSTSTLWIKAGGDPFLVSEELALIAHEIAGLKPGKISGIGFDVSLFEADLVVPGATQTNNPYDAVPSAIAANFNTINLKKVNGKVLSAEAQTPLTDYALQFLDEIVGDSLRVNTGRHSRDAERYFAQLMVMFLKQNGVDAGDRVSWGIFPDGSPDYVHYNSRNLGQIVKGMLKYSTNFIANQLMLTLVAEQTAKPANFAAVHDYLQQQLSSSLTGSGFLLYEGAGLSPMNRLSPRQLIELLAAFKPWRHLLDEVEPGMFAKTGTLSGVSTLAGYLDDGRQSRLFAIMINEPVTAGFTRELALQLQKR